MAKTFEDNIARLEEIVTALEKGDAKLADSLKLFEEGTKLVHDCGAMLDKAEQNVRMLPWYARIPRKQIPAASAS